jgi:hypothetical protein
MQAAIWWQERQNAAQLCFLATADLARPMGQHDDCKSSLLGNFGSFAGRSSGLLL